MTNAVMKQIIGDGSPLNQLIMNASYKTAAAVMYSTLSEINLPLSMVSYTTNKCLFSLECNFPCMHLFVNYTYYL